MKDLNRLHKPKSPWKVSKTMEALQNLKKGKVWEIKFRNADKLDKEFTHVLKLAKDFQENNIDSERFKTEMNVSEKAISWIFHDNYVQKYGNKSEAELKISRLPTETESNYNLAIWRKWEDARFWDFQTVDDVLERMKDLVG